MCGIIAILSRNRPISPTALAKATQQLKYRGPDKQSQWIASHQKVGLGHARLSIIDLATGDQPIANENKQLHLIVNGELYDFERIRCELKQQGHQFRTLSDSEIVLHLYEEYGTECLHYLRGEFAFILWDERHQILFAARDRFGIKPLFYTMFDNTLYLASEAKALFAAGVPPRWDYESFFQQLFLYVNQDRTLFENVYQVPPGHYLLATRDNIQIVRYWDLDYPRTDDLNSQRTDTEYIEQVRLKLEEAVKIRLRADVPVGSFLSGGLDSSSILGIAAKHSAQPVRAFTVTFDGAGYDEEAIARETATWVGADLQLIPLNQADFADHISDAVWHAETLDTNSRGVARYLQSRLVRDRGYKVILSGEGADEIFAGYGHVKQDLRLNQIKQELGESLGKNSDSTPAFLQGVQQTLGFVPSWLKNVAVNRAFFHLLLAPDYAVKFANHDVYLSFLNQFDLPGQLVGRNKIIQSLYLWSKSILPNYSLFAERLEMAHAVEIRVPFLDHHLFELVREIPISLLTHGLQEKYVLREAAQPFLTNTVYTRPKHPFMAPPATLTINKLYTMMQDCLRSSVMESVPFFEQTAVIGLLDELPRMSERQLVAVDSTLMMLLSTYFLHSRYQM
ncbi:asparagine synthase (glutamine-hydrolysing) [Calothrix brevissima NIES-22]|nr:asparagine synthase (glutamine-hydrolysing) [Calothrix brevissima NIES-22]